MRRQPPHRRAGSPLLVGCTEEPQELPEHAYTTFGDHWRCERGFKRVEDECQSVEVPEHAFLSYSGDDWKCERGYKRVKEQCQVVQVPEHAFLKAWGDEWECERGFRRSGNRCAPE